MPEGYEALTEKEKETLRLIVRGHDAKSMANELSLSVHTINERLRAARRKLSVTSSREAARVVLEHEEPTPENSVPKGLGAAATGNAAQAPAGPAHGRRRRLFLVLATAGAISMLTLIAALALSSFSTVDPTDEPPREVAASDRIIEDAAREWLALVDAGNWRDSFDAAGESFREVNTVAGWTEASEQARTPLGDMRSREVVEVKYLNAPPRGYRSIVFFTTFADGGEALEMITLEREPTGWHVVGYVIE